MTGRGISRDTARAAFAASGLAFADVSSEMLGDLRSRLSLKLKESGLFDGTFRMTKDCRIVRGHPGGSWASLRCSSRYFEGREAVTFNPDGFVGFAGWADDGNVVPIL